MSTVNTTLPPLRPLQPLAKTDPIIGTAPAGDSQSFASAMQAAISSVENSSAQSNQAIQNFLSGDATDIHTVALATQRAEISMEMFQQVRNKVISAYQEIMRSQL